VTSEEREIKKKVFRETVVHSLGHLRQALEQFEQTTHGSLSEFSIEGFAARLILAWNDPTPYNVSELYQLVQKAKVEK